jgi:exopolysaccharide production protein ExoQ
MQTAIVISAVATSSTINPALIPAQYASVMQVIALAMWLTIIAASLFARPLQTLSGTDFVLVVSFYAWAILSVAWSNWSVDSALKGTALAVTTFGAYRLATRLPLSDIVAAITLGLFFLLVLSVLCVIFLPEIGIDQSWMHGGQWQGIFESKQSLGLVAAYGAFFALYRRMTGGSWTVFIILFAISAGTLIASGSRGTAAVMVMSCCALLLCRLSLRFANALAWLPLACTCVAFALFMYLYATGYDHFPLFGEKIDLTERTFIWQYGIAHVDQRPFFGFGLNGFWTDPGRLQRFKDIHTWVLDNFHSGYLTILVECGLIGFVIFLGVALFFAIRIGGLTSSKAVPAPYCAIVTCFVALSFQMNMTETLFLRSTSFMSVLFVVFLFLSCHSIPERRSKSYNP